MLSLLVHKTILSIALTDFIAKKAGYPVFSLFLMDETDYFTVKFFMVLRGCANRLSTMWEQYKSLGVLRAGKSKLEI